MDQLFGPMKIIYALESDLAVINLLWIQLQDTDWVLLEEVNDMFNTVFDTFY